MQIIFGLLDMIDTLPGLYYLDQWVCFFIHARPFSLITLLS